MEFLFCLRGVVKKEGKVYNKQLLNIPMKAMFIFIERGFKK